MLPMMISNIVQVSLSDISILIYCFFSLSIHNILNINVVFPINNVIHIHIFRLTFP